MANERKTEILLKAAVIEINKDDPVRIEEQSSDNATIKKLFSRKRPEHIITHPEIKDTVIVTECKAITKDHKKACDEVLVYAGMLSNNFNVIAIAASGEDEKNFKISAFTIKHGINPEESYIMLSDETLRPFKNYLMEFDTSGKKLTEKKLIEVAKSIHEYMYAKAKLSETEKPLLISGILIALMNSVFRKSYQSHKSAKTLSAALFKAIETVMKESDIPKNKMQNMLHPYSFITIHTILNEKDILLDLIIEIEDKVFPHIVDNSEWDIVGKFYGEFLSYVAGDKKSLGIVLTPKHITELMINLLQVNKDTVLLDTCAGTGGFLITGMNKMISDAKNDKTKIENIKKNQLIGFELQPNMFALAASNMILRGDGKANLILGSCFMDKNSMKDLSTNHKFTSGIINPPYNQKGEGLSELSFIENLLEYLEPNSLAAAIVPMSCAIKPSETKNKLLKNHTLEAVMSMPDNLFYPVGVVTCIMIFTAKRPHVKGYKTWFGYWKDDNFEITRTGGRCDKYKTWNTVMSHWAESYYNREIKIGQSTVAEVNSTDEWCAESHITIDYNELTPNSFAGMVKNYASWKLKSKRITSPFSDIDISNWKKFDYEDLFYMENGNSKYRKNDIIIGGKTPLITSTIVNNGVSGYVDSPADYSSNCITISIRGGGNSFYQEKPFSASLNTLILKPKFKINKYIGLFLCSIIDIECPLYSYGRIRTLGRMKTSTLLLPATKKNVPDWKFMTNYIKSLPLSKFV